MLTKLGVGVGGGDRIDPNFLAIYSSFFLAGYDASRTLEGNARWNDPVTSGSSDQQVMVSYSWTQKEVARQIYHELIG